MLEILKSKKQIHDARYALRFARRSALTAFPLRILKGIKIAPGLPIGDYKKSWDVKLTLDLIDAYLPIDAKILDLGAFCSEVPIALSKMGYSNVHGIDLNPNLRFMPSFNTINYTIGDFLHTPYSVSAFDCITAISVIEHGYNPESLFAEVGRLLRPGGLFIASFDYWPEKIETKKIQYFGMSWIIFSETDYQNLLVTAMNYRLRPLGEINTLASERTIHCGGRDYTFAWSVLQKD